MVKFVKFTDILVCYYDEDTWQERLKDRLDLGYRPVNGGYQDSATELNEDGSKTLTFFNFIPFKVNRDKGDNQHNAFKYAGGCHQGLILLGTEPFPNDFMNYMMSRNRPIWYDKRDGFEFEDPKTGLLKQSS